MTDDVQTPGSPAAPPPPPPQQPAAPAPQYQQPAPQQPPGKKGLSPLAWIGIGCGVLVLVVLIGMVGLGLFARHKLKQAGISVDMMEKNPAEVAARMYVAANPDLEMVEVDSGEGTVTVRNTKTGEVITLNMGDIEKGKISIRDEKSGKEVHITASGKGGESGSLTVTDESGKKVFQSGEGAAKDLPEWAPVYPGASTEGHFSMTNEGEKMVTLSLKTKDPVDKVLQFYESKLKAGGFSTSITTQSGDGGKAGFIIGNDEQGGRSVQVSVSEEDGATSIGLSCTEKVTK